MKNLLSQGYFCSKILLFCLLAAFFCTARASEILIEAEDATLHNWNGRQVFVQEDGTGASGGEILQTYTRDLPKGQHSFSAELQFTVTEPGIYHIWLSTTPQNAGWTSPLHFSIDKNQTKNLAGTAWQSASYAKGFLGWFKAETIQLEPGEHTLRLSVHESRSIDDYFIAYVDCIYLTTDPQFLPGANYYVSPLQKSWEEIVCENGNAATYCRELNKAGFYRTIANRPLEEGYSAENTQEVLTKMSQRPLPATSASNSKTLHRFGVHGMEAPFLTSKSSNQAKIEQAFELLAKAGVNTLRTAESCWHRLGTGTVESFDYSELDYQIRLGRKYGMNFCFTIGYPPDDYAIDTNLSAVRPEYEEELRRYLKAIIPRCAANAQYFEYANEVDAPSVWWRGATAQDYVRECTIAREELNNANCSVPFLGISSTYARDNSHDSAGEGQAFCRQAAEAGIGGIVDGYSLHYTWPLNQRDFVSFFRDLTPATASKRLVNSEECGYGHPGDVVKLFARDLYLYDLESVYYYLGQDWIEAGNTIPSGLFDVDWNPKLRLLAMAAATDAMKDRDLIALAEPLPSIEAYLLNQDASGLYAVILWKLGGNEELTPNFDSKISILPTEVTFPADCVAYAVNWRLDQVPFDQSAPVFSIGSEPLIVYCQKLPAWPKLTAQEFLERHPAGPATKALIPGEQ